MSCSNPLSYGFGCNVKRPRNVLGKVFGYFDTLTKGVRTDSGVTLTGRGGSVIANAAEAGVGFQAKSYPKECIFLEQTSKRCGGSAGGCA